MSRHFLLAVKVTLPVLLLFLLAIWLYGDVWIPTDAPGTRPRADLMTMYAAAELALEDPANMYSQALQGRRMAEITGLPISGDDLDFLPFAYPAATALALAPLTFFEYCTAYWLMAAVNILALGYLIYLLGSGLTLGSEAAQTLALSATVCVGVYATLVQGQLSILAVLALSMAVLDMRRNRNARAGLWAGLLSLKPVLLPGFLLWTGMRRRWATLATTCAISALFALVSLAWLWPKGIAGYRDLSTKMLNDSFYTAQGHQMSNLRGLAHQIALGDAGWFFLVTGLLMALWFARVGKSWDYILMLLALPLLSLHLNIQEMVVLIPAIAVACTLLPMTPCSQRIIVLGVFAVTWSRALCLVPLFPTVLLALALWIALSGRFKEHSRAEIDDG